MSLSFRAGRTRFEISYLFFAVAMIFLIWDKSRMSVAIIVSSVAHEAAHIAAMALCGQMPSKISFGLTGIKAVKPNRLSDTVGKDMFIFLAGPGVNLFAAAVIALSGGAGRLGFFFAANLFLGVFNLLPVGTMDGGNFLGVLLGKHLSDRVANLAGRLISFFILAILFLVGFILAFSPFYNPTLLFIAVYLLIGELA